MPLYINKQNKGQNVLREFKSILRGFKDCLSQKECIRIQHLHNIPTQMRCSHFNKEQSKNSLMDTFGYHKMGFTCHHM